MKFAVNCCRCSFSLWHKLFYAAHFYWEGSVRNKDARRLDLLVKKAVIAVNGAILGEMVERYILNLLEAILNNFDHPL